MKDDIDVDVFKRLGTSLKRIGMYVDFSDHSINVNDVLDQMVSQACMQVASDRVLPPPPADEFIAADQYGVPLNITPKEKEEVLKVFHRLREPIAQAWGLESWAREEDDNVH